MLGGANTDLEIRLGKTVVAIALICSRPWKNALRSSRATLVICPTVGIISHWASELKTFAPHLIVHVYHGSDRSGDPAVIGKGDVVLTTYSQIMSQHRFHLLKDNPTKYNPKMCPLFQMTFHRIVLDEAHYIRNPKSKTAAACWALKKRHGMCLSGTPLQNEVRDIFSLLKFLDVRYAGLDELEEFDKAITKPVKYGIVSKVAGILRDVLQGYMIHRPKSTIALPRRHEHMITAELTPNERTVLEYVEEKMPFRSMFAKLIRLRQACDHPHLLSKVVDSKDLRAESEEKEEADFVGTGARTMTHMQTPTKIMKTKSTKYHEGADATTLHTVPAELCSAQNTFSYFYLSSKMLSALDILEDIKARTRREKTIVFSHFKLVLVLMGEALDQRSIRHVMYEGDMSSDERVKSLERIEKDEKFTVILMSIMAGGTGLNITSCNHVILMEPWWNPFVESQACDRVHRFGQNKPVHIYRLIVENSIEENIVATQKKKREMVEEVLSLFPVFN